MARAVLWRASWRSTGWSGNGPSRGWSTDSAYGRSGLIRFRRCEVKAAAPGTTLPELERIARAQALRTRSDLVFANVLGDIAHDVLLVDVDRARHFPTRDAALDALLAALPG